MMDAPAFKRIEKGADCVALARLVVVDRSARELTRILQNIHVNRYGETQTRLDQVLKLVLETRYAKDPVSVRLETAGL